MSESIWIELIKIIPTFVWLGLGIGALIVAKRLLAQQAHRMTRVESPFVSVDFAQDAIAQAFNRGPETPASEHEAAAVSAPPASTDASQDQADWKVPVTPDGWPAPNWQGPSTRDEADRTHMLRPRQSTEPASEDDDPELSRLLDEIADGAGEGVPTAVDARAPQPTATPPSGAPTYPPVPAQQSYPGMYQQPPGAPPTGTTAYRPPSYFAAVADPQRGLRAATRLAASADLLQGGAILWVDDHPHWNEPLVRLFRTAGMRVDTVGTTDEALRFLDRGDYDLVITDLRRERDPGDTVAGMALLDRMINRGFPTPAIVFSDNPQVRAMSHPRAAATTNSPEELVNHVVDLVGHRRNAMNQGTRSNMGGLLFGNG